MEKYTDFECIFIEINLNKKKWLIVGTYNPCNSMIKNHLYVLSSFIDVLCVEYENFIIMGDFNAEPKDKELIEFCNSYCLKSLINEPTCYKNINNPKCIDLILTNRSRSFQNSDTLETGLSDFHKMTLTVMKTQFQKLPPKIIIYRDYKNYEQNQFNHEFNDMLNQHNFHDISNDVFVELTMNLLDRHAPLKQKYIRANQGPFMTKELQKSIMLRSKLRNRYLKLKTEITYSEYKKQRNVCTSLLRKAKRDYFSNLDPSNVTDNKKFWRAIKPLFSEKSITKENIILVEENNIINDDLSVAQTFDDFFSNAVKNLNIEVNKEVIMDDINEVDPILKSINKYLNHPSIISINESMKNDSSKTSFSFEKTTFNAVYNEIISLDLSKSSPKNSVPTKIIKDNCTIFASKLLIDFNNSIMTGVFPNNLKCADVTPTHKKGDRTDKTNYRPISLLSTLSKIFERLLFYQIHTFTESILSKYQCGFRKGYSSQYCLLFMIEKWRQSIDNKHSAGVLLTDLSKAFDCLAHDLLIAKLNAYGFNYKSLLLIHSYLTNRSQRVIVNSNYSSWSEILNGVPQGSILGPILFNIYLSDLFLFTKNSEIVNYADDNSPFACKLDTESVMNKLEIDSKTLLTWISNNVLKANPDKFHLLLNSNDNALSIRVDKYNISNSQNETLLGIVIDNNLKFDVHVNKLCTKASQKLHALARISKYMTIENRKKIMNAFISSQFSYCPLVWMFHSRALNNRINRIHERALRIVYNDIFTPFEQLLQKNNSFTIHERNIQLLAIELFKVIKGYSPEIMKEVLPLKESNNYCSRFPFRTRNARTVRYGTETISFIGPKIWSLIPDEIKASSNLVEFKNKIKKWKPNKCPCRLCKTYVVGLGFIDEI